MESKTQFRSRTDLATEIRDLSFEDVWAAWGEDIQADADAAESDYIVVAFTVIDRGDFDAVDSVRADLTWEVSKVDADHVGNVVDKLRDHGFDAVAHFRASGSGAYVQTVQARIADAVENGDSIRGAN